MRLPILLGALAALASAVPYPQESGDPTTDDPEEPSSFPTPTLPVPVSTSLNIPVTGTGLPEPSTTATRSKNPHWEPIPVFTKDCQCSIATAAYPCWATDALQVSLFHYHYVPVRVRKRNKRKKKSKSKSKFVG